MAAMHAERTQQRWPGVRDVEVITVGIEPRVERGSPVGSLNTVLPIKDCVPPDRILYREMDVTAVLTGKRYWPHFNLPTSAEEGKATKVTATALPTVVGP